MKIMKAVERQCMPFFSCIVITCLVRRRRRSYTERVKIMWQCGLRGYQTFNLSDSLTDRFMKLPLQSDAQAALPL